MLHLLKFLLSLLTQKLFNSTYAVYSIELRVECKNKKHNEYRMYIYNDFMEFYKMYAKLKEYKKDSCNVSIEARFR